MRSDGMFQMASRKRTRLKLFANVWEVLNSFDTQLCQLCLWSNTRQQEDYVHVINISVTSTTAHVRDAPCGEAIAPAERITSFFAVAVYRFPVALCANSTPDTTGTPFTGLPKTSLVTVVEMRISKLGRLL